MVRNEVLMGLVDRAINDVEFREKARADLDGTLEKYGYELTHEELAAVKAFQDRTEGLTEEELDRALVADVRGGRQFGG